MNVTRLASMFKNVTFCRSVYSNQIRLFRHQPEDVNRAIGKPQHQEIEVAKDKPTQEAKIIEQPIISGSYLKQLVKQYGPAAISVFIFVSLSNLAICYIAVKFGIATHALRNETIQNLMLKYPSAQTGGEFVLAYAIHKILAPLRYTLTGIATPFFVEFLRKRGWLKKLYHK